MINARGSLVTVQLVGPAVDVIVDDIVGGVQLSRSVRQRHERGIGDHLQRHGVELAFRDDVAHIRIPNKAQPAGRVRDLPRTSWIEKLTPAEGTAQRVGDGLCGEQGAAEIAVALIRHHHRGDG